MELKWLEDFTCLANTLSFSRAAEARRVTQSAFSRRIKQLEVWLGVILVSRATFPVELTKEGKAFLPVAHESIRNFYATRDALQPPKSVTEQTLTFSALHTLAVVFFPQWLQSMTQALGPFRSRLSPDKGGIEENIGMLVDEEADFLLTYAHATVPFQLDRNRFPYHLLGTERVMPVCSPTARTTLDEALRRRIALPYLSYGAFSFFAVALTKLFSNQPSFERQVLHENTMSIGLKSMALTGWGTAWLPESLIRTELADGTLVPASQNPGWELEVEIRLYRDAKSDRPLVNDFWQSLTAGC